MGMIKKNYYVYMYLDQQNIPFYVGKGKGTRYHVGCHLSKTVFNRFLKNKIKKIGKKNVKIHFLLKNLTEEEAFLCEKYWIQYFGRRDLGEGTLCNLTDGGEGESGRVVSEETRQKISKIHKGKKIPAEVVNRQSKSLCEYYETHTGTFKSKNHTEETREKMCESSRKRWDRQGGVSAETSRKLSEAGKGKPAWNKGRKLSLAERQKIKDGMTAEVKQKLSATAKNRPPMTEETKRKISNANRGRAAWNRGKLAWNRGKKMSEEQKQKLSDAAYRRWEKVRGNSV